jgi:hypothetical protein
VDQAGGGKYQTLVNDTVREYMAGGFQGFRSHHEATPRKTDAASRRNARLVVKADSGSPH